MTGALPPLDATKHFMRRRAAELFPGGRVTPNALAANIAFGAAVLGARHVELTNDGDWWFVASDFDWLAQPNGDSSGLFERLTPFPEQGPGSHRSEVYVTAFAACAYTMRNDNVRWLAGDGAHHAARLPHEGRLPPWCTHLLAFSFA